MEAKLPVGLKVLAILNILFFMLVLVSLSKHKEHMIFMGQIVGGAPYAVYYGCISMAHGVMGIGLLKRQKWAFIGSFVLESWDVLMSLADVLMTSRDTLIKAGFRMQDPMRSFYGGLGVRIAISFLVLFWLTRYTTLFSKNQKASDL